MISEKPADSHTVEVSVMEVYNNEVLDLLAKDAQGNPAEQRCDVITTSNGASQVIALKYQWVQPQLRRQPEYKIVFLLFIIILYLYWTGTIT